MKRKLIHFAHANGFPAKTYSKLFSFLEDEFQVGFLEQHGHNPDFPVTDNWKFLQRELESEIEARYSEPVIGVGQSLGGILHLLTAADRPELFRAIVLLDAPVISRTSSLGLKILKRINLPKRHSLSEITKKRRKVWANFDEAFEHFRSRAKFDAFDEDVLRDYVRFGTEVCEQGIRLTFKPSVEADIYETLPVDLPKLRGKIKIPIAYIGGTNSREARLANLRFMKKHFNVNFQFLEGSHLFPFENPEETAKAIKSAIIAIAC